VIGAIADDFTGGTDVAVAFRRAGLRTVILFGGTDVETDLPEHDAIVVALKTRTIPAADAVAQSVDAATWLLGHGADQLFFKFCSTFDSRPEGNIGPVADALSALVGASRAVVVPSSPEHLRTQYMGHLFVDTQLLSDSPMRHHPLTPMTDSFIPRVLAPQTDADVALVDLRTVRQGRGAVRDSLDAHQTAGVHYVVVDALTAEDLVEIGHACLDDALVTGAAGLAGGLGAARAERSAREGARPAEDGEGDLLGDVPAAVLAGSCSARTLEQIADMRRTHDAYQLDAVQTPDAEALAADALAWYDARASSAAPVIYSSLPPEELRRSQEILGIDRASEINETAMGLIARGLTTRGVRRLVVAGGETSGAVVSALHVAGGLIGEEAAPGVPWIYTTDQEPVALLLKSGNFGDPGLLTRSVRPTAPIGATA
jgi:uncharacterized protein YgbK (DUF1537 family)